MLHLLASHCTLAPLKFNKSQRIDDRCHFIYANAIQTLHVASVAKHTPIKMNGSISLRANFHSSTLHELQCIKSEEKHCKNAFIYKLFIVVPSVYFHLYCTQDIVVLYIIKFDFQINKMKNKKNIGKSSEKLIGIYMDSEKLT